MIILQDYNINVEVVTDNPTKKLSGILGENMNKQEIINQLMEQDILVTPEMLEQPEDELLKFLPSKVKIIKSYDKTAKKKSYNDFVGLFKLRYKKISELLRTRQELSGVTAIARIKQRREKENVSIIGMVIDKNITKNGNYIINVEDMTGEITVIITQQNKEAFDIAADMVLDEIIGISGQSSGDAIFANKIILPDVPLGRTMKHSPKEEFMILIGDPHVGSKEFLRKEFMTFISWLNGKVGNEEQKRTASKVKYIIFTGDVIEGVGIYPNQDEDLEILDIYDQYEDFSNLLKKIPENIQIVIAPGNHDAGRIAEPQPPIPKNFAKALYEMSNVTMISSPGWVNIGATETFVGFDLLIYHGYSLIYYSDNVPSIRNAGGQKATDQIMSFLLKRRHLAPTHGSNLYIPDPEEDHLIIDKIPDFFITGHIHRIAYANYRGVSMINASTWTDITEDQEKRGLEPQPARVPLINLKTREVKIMNFYRGKKINQDTK